MSLRTFLFAGAILVCAAAVTLNAARSGVPDAVVHEDGKPEGIVWAGSDAGLKPNLLWMFGRKHYYQLPKGTPKGMVAVFPGCARSVYGFWPCLPASKEFYGFPEDVSHTKQILGKGYAILVMTPNEQRTLCWSSKGEDPSQAVEIIQYFQAATKLDGKPLYLLGASSGGSLASNLTGGKGAGLHINGLILEVSTHALPSAKSPPTVWVVMERDEKSQAEVRDHLAFMAKTGIPSASAVSPVRRIMPSFFSDQMAAITPRQSAQMADALLKIGLIDASGNLMADPKDAMKGGAFKWDGKLKQRLPWLDNSPATSLTFRKSGIWQALLAAWAKHEHTAIYTTAALEWFEAGMKGDFGDLSKKHAVVAPTSLEY